MPRRTQGDAKAFASTIRNSHILWDINLHSDFMLQPKMASNLPAATSFCENMIKRMQKKLEEGQSVLRGRT